MKDFEASRIRHFPLDQFRETLEPVARNTYLGAEDPHYQVLARLVDGAEVAITIAVRTQHGYLFVVEYAMARPPVVEAPGYMNCYRVRRVPLRTDEPLDIAMHRIVEEDLRAFVMAKFGPHSPSIEVAEPLELAADPEGRFLHFSGLGANQESWYYNSLGAQVQVYQGDWVRLDPASHPELRDLICRGVATVCDSAPDGVEIFDEETSPKSRPRPPRWAERAAVRVRTHKGAGLPEARALSCEEIDRARHLCMIGEANDYSIEYVDAVPKVRHRAPRAGSLSQFAYPNVLLLHRLAELWCRACRQEWKERVRAVRKRQNQFVEEHHLEFDSDRAALRRQAERKFPLPKDNRRSVADVLHEWGTTRSNHGLSASTLYRYHQPLGITREDVDVVILAALTANRPVQIVGRVGAGLTSVAIGPYVPEGQASRLTPAPELDGALVWVFLPHDGRDPEIVFHGAKAAPSLGS